ncbi:MAG: DMT family transporter [Chloroflexi bacterium]|nr:DMT family transporter [Chloroflexota bacterium]
MRMPDAGGRATAASGILDRRRLAGLGLVVVSACAFGSGALFAKPIYASGMDWLGLLAWRFLFAALLSWAWLLAWPSARQGLRRLPRRQVLGLVALGVLYIGNSSTYFAALETVSASLAALIVYLYPALVAVLSIRFGRRLEGRRAWLALAMATLGVGLAVGGIDPSTAPPGSGLLLALASPVIYSVWIVLSARLGGERPEQSEFRAGETSQPAPDSVDPAPASAVMLTATAVVYWVAAVLGGRPVNPMDVPAQAWPALVGVGVVSTALALQSFYAGVRRVGAANGALISTVEPIWTISLATLLFGELLTAVQVAGGVLVIGAVLLMHAGSAAAPAWRSGTVTPGGSGAA